MLIDFLKRTAFYSLLATVLALSFSITLYEAASVVFVVAAFSAMILERDARLLRGRWFIFIAVYFIANLLSFVHTGYPVDSLKGITRILRLLLLSLGVVYIVDSEEKFKKVFGWTMIVAFCAGVDGLLQGFTGFEIVRQRAMTAYTLTAGRITASFRHSNDFAAYLTLVIFLFLGSLAEFKRSKTSPRKILFSILGAALLCACLLWTYCRGAWLGVAVAFFVMALLKKKKILLAVLALGVLWAVFLSPPMLRDRFRSLLDPHNGTITERKVLAEESLDMIDQHPWFGMGINTFSDNAPFYKSKTHITDVQYAHNGYLQMTVETGIVGLLSFLCLLFYFFSATLPVFLKPEPGCLEIGGAALVFGVLAFLIHSFTDTNLHSLLLVANLWVFMGLAMAAVKLIDPQRVCGRGARR